MLIQLAKAKTINAFKNIGGESFAKQKKLIVHFSYHKCMTKFSCKVFSRIARSFGLYQQHHNSCLDSFYEDIKNIDRTSIISVNNGAIDFNKLPPYAGSHFIRDPRDLLVSGYRYHLWCNEERIAKPMTDQMRQILKPQDLGIGEEFAKASFQEILNNVDKLTGYSLELNYRRPHFDQMRDWDFSNPSILEMKYEDIFGNEVQCFEKLFKHYGFPQYLIPYSLKVVKKHSFSSLQKKSNTLRKKHASVGSKAQWKELLPAEIKEIIKKEYGDLLIKLGYEKDYDWVA
jgi:hypothetical protein